MQFSNWVIAFLFLCLLSSGWAQPLRVAIVSEAEPEGWRGVLKRPEVVVGEVADAEVLLVIGGREIKPGRGVGMVRMEEMVPRGETKIWKGTIPLFFTPPGREHGITQGISNYEVSGSVVWNREMDPAARVLATTWTPHQKKLRDGEPQPYVYGVSPVLWTLEIDGQRTVGCAVGGGESLNNPAFRCMLMRALAWAAHREKVDTWCTTQEREAIRYPPGGPVSPLEAVQQLTVHPDFVAELVAAEPLISKPINIDWDEKGRLWVVESVEYPEGRKGGGPESMFSVWQRETALEKPSAVLRPGRDTISRLEDLDGDGRMDVKHVFADDLDLVTSFCFYKDGVIAAQPPQILWLRDTNGDGREDKREVLYTGLGTMDTHAVLNNLRWGLDGWIYATHGYSASPKVTSGDGAREFGAVNSGIVRFRPDGSAFEMVSAKGGNCWGVDITSEGELFFTQPTSGDLLMHVPVSDAFMAEGGLGREPSWKVLIHLRPVKPLMTWEEIAEIQCNDVTGSFTAACGCAIYEGGSWPDVWTRGYFTCEPTVHIVHHETITPEGASFAAAKARDEEFTATRDPWHRPIDTRLGPDGNIYVTDFYNQAILHNDPRGPIHLWNNQAARPDRDHFFGRLIRLKHRESRALPGVDLSSLEGRMIALQHPNRAVRFRAQRLLEENAAQLTAASAHLVSATGSARLHTLWLRAAAGLLESAEIVNALKDADISMRVSIARVLAEHPGLVTQEMVQSIGGLLGSETDPRVRLLLLAAVPRKMALPPALLVTLSATAPDAWTKAAVARNARSQPAEVLSALIAANHAGDVATPLMESLIDFARGDAAQLSAIVGALVMAPESRSDLVAAALARLSMEPLPGDAGLAEKLSELAAKAPPAIMAVALPLAAATWSEAELRERLPEAAAKIATYAMQPSTSPADRARSLAALARLPLLPGAIGTVLLQSLADPVLRKPILQALAGNQTTPAVMLLLEALTILPQQEKAAAVEILLTRRDSALALLDSLDQGLITPAMAGTAVLSRLQNHPDATVKEKAAPVVARLRGANEARDAIVARMLPEISKPGDAGNGKAIFAACAVCHQFQGQGQSIGPVLDGIGIHSVDVLLTHIIDPNREVEPSFLAWNFTTKDQQTLAGIISRETASSLFIKNATGEVEIPRDKIISQSNTGASLMPEGFEALGPEVLRDLIAFLHSGEQRFHAIAFGKAATADGSRGVYQNPEAEVDRVSIKKYGLTQIQGVPFSLPDPAASPTGRNVIVLKGGAQPNVFSMTMPDSVTLTVGQNAGRLHMLGAVAGWGWPAVQAKEPVVKCTVQYADGETEDLVFVNGIDFADHIARIDVPGSAPTDITEKGQMRYLWRDLKHPGKLIDHLTLSGFTKAPAPLIAALTLESPGADGRMAAPPPVGGLVISAAGLPPQPIPGKLRVLLAGGGSSHDFAQWFDKADQKSLGDSGRVVSIWTDQPAQATDQLAHADVLVLSANDAGYQQNQAFREALEAFANSGGGLVLLHPAVWHNWALWPKYNATFVGGGARGHDAYGEFSISLLKPAHPVVQGLPATFTLKDELYRVVFDAPAGIEILAQTSPAQDGKSYPSIWITPHPRARIVCIAPGHDAATHGNANFQRLLVNAVDWTGTRK